MFDGAGYQTFDFLGEDSKSSNSKLKYELSGLKKLDLNKKSVLDIGCNSGYFLFKILQDSKPEYLFGIDLGRKFIDKARQINSDFFNSKILKFIEGDFFNTIFTVKFDLIICFSTFHYFLDNQCIFFKDCFFLLKEKGILLLEIEEFPEDNFPIVDKSIRPADKKSYHYPNQRMLDLWYRDMFSLKEKSKSVKQGGSLYDRYFYRLEKN